MESWNFVSSEKGFVPDEAISATETIRSTYNTGIIGWESKSPYSYGSNMVMISSQEATKNQEFVELGFPEMPRKLSHNDSISDILSSKIGSGRIENPISSIPNSFSIEEESSSKLSSSVVESSDQDFSLFDLKLGRFGDQREVQNPNSAKSAPNLSSSGSSMPVKRVRVTGLSSHTPFCQVHGCKKDLSSSKDYHKRHKVCEVHSKTAKVIVNGIEQRFCQQCSRFHLLGEFDDGKRSCRKRLAGHNERRRKPHGIHSGRPGRLFQSYNGSIGGRFQETLLTTSSFICQDILPCSVVNPHKYDTNDWSRHIKLEDGADYSPRSAITIRNEYLHPKSVFPSYCFENHCPSFQENASSNVNEKSNRYPIDLSGSNSVPRGFFQNASMGSQDFPLFDLASTVQGLSELSDSGRALSLLSSQSHNSRYSSGKVPESLFGVSSQGSTSGVSNKFYSSEMNCADENQLGPILISDENDALDFGIGDGLFQGSGYVNSKDRLSCEDGPTIDLLQLSSQLQRVEHQRHSMQVKEENDAFCGLRIT